MRDLYFHSAAELAERVRSRELSPREIIEEALRRVEAVNPQLNAFVALRPDQALDEAERMGVRIASGEDPGPLAGIPIGVKDLEDVEGMVTSFGSIPFKEHVAKGDSVQVARLRRAGAIVLGKTNTPEFGFTGFTRNRLFGITRNPWNPEKTPGGSSGGSAAAVAAGMVPLATGSDAGGSIRIPASYSGCFGIKPSFGRIPLGPFDPLHMTGTWTLGPLCRTVMDAALYLDCTAGYHPADPCSLPRPAVSYRACLHETPSNLKIAFSPTLGYARVQKDVAALAEQAVQSFEQMGHRVELWQGTFPEVSVAWTQLMSTELYTWLRKDFDRIREDLGRTLAATLDQARLLSTDSLAETQEIRTRLNKTLWKLFERFDLLLTPTMPTEAFGAKGPPPSEVEGHPIPLMGAVAFTYPFNLSGHPAATVPAGFTGSGLPAGLQIVGPRHRDGLVLQAARAYERISPWDKNRPPLDSFTISRQQGSPFLPT
jgi:Asp-tRNA(Asn)/Glu-tRNA(Gln) amidotransferase A subunit family amidase